MIPSLMAHSRAGHHSPAPTPHTPSDPQPQPPVPPAGVFSRLTGLHELHLEGNPLECSPPGLLEAAATVFLRHEARWPCPGAVIRSRGLAPGKRLRP
jgi:hypothetical protein